MDNNITVLELKKLADLCNTNLNIFNTKNATWRLKDKRVLLKECNIIRRTKIKEIIKVISELSKNTAIELTHRIKDTNINLINDIENIDSLINVIENDYPSKDNFLEKFSN
jgi:hypothetical protein